MFTSRTFWIYVAIAVIPRFDSVWAQIRSDEVVVFFPTFAHQAEGRSTWIVPIHGWIYEPETDSLTRAAALDLFRRALGLERGEAETAIFKERARLFLVDNQRAKRIRVRIAGNEYFVATSEPNGHFAGELRVIVKEPARSVTFLAVTRQGDPRVFAGGAQLLGETGTSIISDIDDTVKVSEVSDRRALLCNTFLREFEAVPGMAKVYQQWAADGASFHYISASPWQLYEPLARFLRESGFPRGSYHLKSFRWKDTSFFNLFDSPEKMKSEVIEAMLKPFPRRTFALVGDTGEKDPEIYGDLARKYPQQIRRIFIRNVTGERADSERFIKAFEGIPKDCWMIFTKPEEIRNVPDISGFLGSHEH